MIPIARSTPTQRDSSCCTPLAGRASRIAAAVARPFQHLRLIAQVFLIDRNREGFFYALRRVFRTAETIRHVESSFPELMNEDYHKVGYHRVCLIKAIRDVPRGERDDVVHYIQGLLGGVSKIPEFFRMYEHEREAIIEKIGHVPGEERAEVLRYAQDLCTDRMNGWDRAVIIKAIRDVPGEERAEVLRYAQDLFTDGRSGNETAEIIGTISLVPRGKERAEVICYAQELFTNRMSGYVKEAIIRKIGYVPREERAEVIRHAQEFFTDGMSGGLKAAIIEKMGHVPREERAEVIRYAQELFTDRMNVRDRVGIFQDVADVPRANRAAYVQQRMRGEHVDNHVAAQHGVNVHEGKRDQLSETFLRKLWEYQGEISKDQIDQAVKDFKGYIDQLLAGNTARRALVLDALCEKPSNKDFGPLISNTRFQVSTFSVSGEELIGRLWIFASKITDTKDRENAKQGMISALEKSYETGFDEEKTRVCNPGKAQRLIVGVLQGRLKGVNLDIPKLTAGDAMKGFFQKEEHQNIRDLTTLLEAAKQFCRENPDVGEIEAAFLKEIHRYAELQGIGSERSE